MSTMQAKELHAWGVGVYAYIRPCTGAEAKALFPFAPPGLQENARYFALFEADGTPMMLTRSRNSAVGCASSNDLQVMMWQ